MKDEELDRLFKQNSELFRAEPSPQAWQQLEQQLQQKRGKKIWIYISGVAASLLLLGGLWLSMDYGQTFLNPDSANLQEENEKAGLAGVETEETQERETVQTDQGKIDPSEEQQHREQQPEKKQEAKAQEAPGKKQQLHPAKSRKQLPPANSSVAAHKKRKTNTEAEGTSLLPELPDIENKEAKALAIADKNPGMPNSLANIPGSTEDIIIRYSAEAEYNSQLAAAQETPGSLEEDKGLSARSVIGFLKKVKESSSDGLSDIREAKDQLLSIRMNR